MAARKWWNEARQVAWMIDEVPGKRRYVATFSPKKNGGTKEGAMAAAQKAADEINAKRAEREGARAARGGLAADKPIPGRVGLLLWLEEISGGVSRGYAHNSRRMIELHLAPFCDRKQIDLRYLTREHVMALGREMAEKPRDRGPKGTLGYHSARNAGKTLAAACHWLERNRERLGLGEFKALRGTATIAARAAESAGAAEGEREAWTHAEAELLLEEAKSNPALRPLLVIALHTGARKAELLGLDWKDVHLHGARDESEPHFKVRQTLLKRENEIKTSGKTRNSRRNVKLSPVAVETLEELRRQRARELGLTREEPGRVFRSRTGEPWSYDGMGSSWEAVRDRAFAKHGVRPLEFHSFRHTYVSWALDRHVNLGWLCEQVGDTAAVLLSTYKHFVRGTKSDHSFLSAREPSAPRPALSGRVEGEAPLLRVVEPAQ